MVQYTSKMKLRFLPLLQRHYETNHQPPEAFALGFAAYLQFMKPVEKKGTKYFGKRGNEEYEIVDDSAEYFYNKQTTLKEEAITTVVMKDAAFWGIDLSSLPGFSKAVLEKQKQIQKIGLMGTIESIQSKKVLV